MFTLRYAANDTGRPRLGVVVPKRQIKLASHRNRAKRLVRESFRKNRAQLPPVDIVVQIFAAADTIDGREMIARLNTGWDYVRRSV